MAEDIKQTYSIDASDALDALKALDAGFAQLSQQLNNSSSAFSAFNSGASKTVSALIEIRDRANEAFAALQQVAGISGSATAGAGSNVGGSNVNTQNLAAGAAAAQALNSQLAQTNASAGQAAQGVTQVGQAASSALPAASQAAGGFSLSLETISRVLATQALIRGLNAIRDAAESAFSGFLEFNKALAEIQTIAQDQSLATLGANVRSLSDEFNAPLLDVAKAKYQALSNGFVQAGESTTLLDSALKLSKVGVSSTTQAVDLLATALNSYGKGVSEADTVSAKLFKTIELGRVTAADLSTSFGRVAGIGKEVGVSEDEILAGISSITIGGTKAAEAVTQVRGVLSALLKPSQDATAALHQLGFESGEDLVAANGFQGALQALISTTDGSASSIAKLFPNVRALTGVLRETTTGVDVFQDHLKQIKAAAADVLNKSYSIRIESDGEKVSADINKLKNFLTVDLGSALVSAAAQASQFVGGASNLISLLQNLVPAAAAAAAGVLLYATAAGLAKLASIGMASGVGGVTTAFGLMTAALSGVAIGLAAFGAGNFIGDQLSKSITDGVTTMKKALDDETSFKASQVEAARNLRDIEIDDESKSLNKALALLQQEHNAEVTSAREKNEQLLSEDKQTFDALIKARQDFANRLSEEAKKADKDSVAARKKANDLQGQLSDDQFNFRSKQFDPLTQVSQDRQRADSLSADAASKLKTANSPEDKEAADNAFARAESFAKAAESSAITSKNTTAEAIAEKTIEEVLQRRIDAEKIFADNRAKAADQLKQQAADEDRRAESLKALSKDFLDNADFFNKKGELLPQNQIDDQRKKAQSDLDQIQKLAFTPGAKFGTGDAANLLDLQKRLNDATTPQQIKTLQASGSALNDLVGQIQGKLSAQAFEVAKLAINPKALDGKNIQDQINEVRQQSKEAVDSQKAIGDAAATRAKNEQAIAASVKLGTDALNEQRGTVEKLSDVFNASKDALGTFGSTASLDTIKAQIKELNDIKAVVEKDLQNPGGAGVQSDVQDAAKKLTDLNQNGPSAIGIELSRTLAAVSALQAANQKSQDNALLNSKFGQSNLDSAAQAQQDAAQRQAEEHAKNLSTATADQANNTTQAATAAISQSQAFQNSVDAANQLLAAEKQIADNAERAAAAGPPGGGSGGGSADATKALGGLVSHFAGGGSVRGTDTVPAMLSPKEFVVNQAQSSKFFSQLQSINAGVTPNFNRGGNSGDTFNIGDIVVNGASNPQSTAREVMKQIKREQRRNTGSI